MAGTIALGTLAFDGGSTAAPATGVVITATSGATGVVHVVTVSTGAWGDNDVTGTITLGSCTGLFNDNEAVTWTGGSCTVNHPDGSVGADGYVKNGAFVHDNDPPNDWSAVRSTLTTEAGGKVGNCLKIVATDVNAYATEDISVITGRTYRLSFCYKVTAPDEAQYYVWDNDQSAYIQSLTALADTSGVWSSIQTVTFEIPSGCSSMEIAFSAKNNTDIVYFDEVFLYLLGSGGGGNHYMFMDMKL